MSIRRPELEMVRKALVPGAIAVPVAFGLGLAFGDAGTAWSAALGVAIVVANFAAHGWSLAWASRISVTAVQAVALGGVIVRLGVIVGLMFALNAMTWFSPVGFALAVVPGTMALLFYEAKLTLSGLGGMLQIPADATAVRAAERLAAKEASV
jgi:hypothetical protein